MKDWLGRARAAESRDDQRKTEAEQEEQQLRPERRVRNDWEGKEGSGRRGMRNWSCFLFWCLVQTVNQGETIVFLNIISLLVGGV
ncbi:hypothetical protein BO70DRAFT_71451 [Aspergillus heteromorphus CBS 117.55]|uniref:Uncharacterized protein n=1 Tax=Aspergillus heteromorphus CBS 117.55 TaxID=1448321 RepID=A0A317VUN7_9EURO|nr:uncharacterized protein BO70DRAFT_71451 [Aspergillus heteromorphus CBS 117.55]PWY77051.1 hypothetical protein BO70DRAFT_71451 [Aspergillus heteromorphus CBS 117.55]